MLNQLKNILLSSAFPALVLYLYWQISLIFKIGTYTNGPTLVTFWHAIWIPQAVVVYPFLLGMFFGKLVNRT